MPIVNMRLKISTASVVEEKIGKSSINSNCKIKTSYCPFKDLFSVFHIFLE